MKHLFGPRLWARLRSSRDSLDLMLDGALELGADSGLLAYRGGLGKRVEFRTTIEAWSALNINRATEALRRG